MNYETKLENSLLIEINNQQERFRLGICISATHKNVGVKLFPAP